MRAKRSRPQALGPMTVGESRPGTGQVNVDGQEAEKRQTIQQRWTKRWTSVEAARCGDGVAQTGDPDHGGRDTAGQATDEWHEGGGAGAEQLKR
jgi:hypothetical protein